MRQPVQHAGQIACLSWVLWCASIVAAPLVAQPAVRTTAAPRTDATSLLGRGDYTAAVAAAATGPGGTALTPAHAVVLVRALVALGRAHEAVERSARWRGDPAVAGALGMAHEETGDLDAADASWVVAGRGADSLRARVERLRLQYARGGGDSTLARLRGVLSVAEARGAPRTAGEAHALAAAARLLGRTDPPRFKDALRLYDRALALEPARQDARAELAELFLEKYNSAEARATLQQVLAMNPRHPRALAALVRLDAFDGRRTPRDPLTTLLAVNPSSAVGHALAARRLVDAERYDDAVAQARRGLVLDSVAPAPLVAIAAARWIANDTVGHRVALAQAHRRLPGSAAAEVELAEVSARNRLYADAVTFARAGVARDPRDARALALLGINLLRTGDVVAGRAALDRAFALDPYDVWVKNTLDLLDAFATARIVATPHFDLVVERDDAELMALYASPLAEAAYAALTSRYGFQPDGRVRVEFFRSHADFSVRAVGLAGLGALGVAFGNVLAIDAPPARPRGAFNWGAVLWHEFAHTITLGATANRVPRWVSEGLSVHEERRARPDWGGGATPTLIAAYAAGRLQPVSRLNDGFVHPRFGEEVILSYALSAYVFEMLEQRRGVDGLRALLTGYRAGGATPALMQAVYGLTPDSLDATFDRWFRAKFAREFGAVQATPRDPAAKTGDSALIPDESGDSALSVGGTFREVMTAAAAAAQRRDWHAVVPAATRAISLFPGWADAGSGYHLLATASLALGDTAAAIRTLTRLTEQNGDAIEENLTLARLAEATADTALAVAALERATAIDPFDAATQVHLGSLAYARAAWPASIRARRAVLALGPADRAGAYYQLALALDGAGDRTAARREVLRALDLAPTFEAAQDLLLRLRAPGRAP
ncbi:MAG: tetratricopeptide repeat protein [Gemmatimonadaceae bacterium]|nr:tetratricopeptide repeat protein [Gemmatimonadaceae bacterium]